MSDALGTPIDDLELSVRSFALLNALGVETVADLLALPSISATPVVVAELTEILAEMELSYEGEWVVPELPSVIEATGTVNERWSTIESWLEDNAAEALETFRPGATPSAIADAEKELGQKLPDDYKELVARHDGQESGGPMVGFCSLIPVAELKKSRDWVAGLLSSSSFDPDATEPGIQAVAWHRDWIPIGNFQRDYLILDLAPAANGAVGQIFSLYVDDDTRAMVATSCADLLSRLFRELQDGTIASE